MISNTRVVLAAASLSSVAPRFPNTSSTASGNSNNNKNNNASTSVSVGVGNNKSNSTSATISLSSGESIPSSAKTRPARTTSTSRQQPPASPQGATPEPRYPEPPALRTMSAYFPLGYKDAAYQWVSFLILVISGYMVTDVKFPVDKRNTANSTAKPSFIHPLHQSLAGGSRSSSHSQA